MRGGNHPEDYHPERPWRCGWALFACNIVCASVLLILCASSARWRTDRPVLQIVVGAQVAAAILIALCLVPAGKERRGGAGTPIDVEDPLQCESCDDDRDGAASEAGASDSSHLSSPSICSLPPSPPLNAPSTEVGTTRGEEPRRTAGTGQHVRLRPGDPGALAAAAAYCPRPVGSPAETHVTSAALCPPGCGCEHLSVPRSAAQYTFAGPSQAHAGASCLGAGPQGPPATYHAPLQSPIVLNNHAAAQSAMPSAYMHPAMMHPVGFQQMQLMMAPMAFQQMLTPYPQMPQGPPTCTGFYAPPPVVNLQPQMPPPNIDTRAAQCAARPQAAATTSSDATIALNRGASGSQNGSTPTSSAPGPEAPGPSAPGPSAPGPSAPGTGKRKVTGDPQSVSTAGPSRNHGVAGGKTARGILPGDVAVGGSEMMAMLIEEQGRRMQELNDQCGIPKPNQRDLKRMQDMWAEHASEVFQASLARETSPAVSQAMAMITRYCRGCGRKKTGHSRRAVHNKCNQVNCWCGVPRMLHPFPVAAGLSCLAEWRDIVVRQEQGPAHPFPMASLHRPT